MLGLRGSLSLCFVSFAVCLFGLSAQAGYDAAAETGAYIFVADQSTVVQTGGIVGVHESYGIEGTFQLTVDSDAGIASFDGVDANLTEPTGFLYPQSLGVLFNMTELAGTVVDDTRIEFEGNTSDDTDTSIQITLTFANDSVHLTGETIPPPGSADFFIFNLDAVARKKYAGGTGTADDPYQIATAADLIALGETPADYDKHFILTDDIDLDPNLPSRKVFDKAVIAPDTDPLEYEFQGTAFTGFFDGDGHTILHLVVDGEDYVGLFGYLASGAEVKDLGVVDVNIARSDDYVGGLVGYNSGSITGSYSSGTVSGIWYVGGLVGENYGTVTRCYSDGAVSGTRQWSSCLGGLVGKNYGGIATSYSTGSVGGSLSVGGLVGVNYGNITTSYSTGLVNGKYDIGGLVGSGPGSVLHSVWNIDTSGLVGSAGGVGLTTAEMTDPYMLGLNGFANDPNWVLDASRDYPRLTWEGTLGQIIREPAIDQLEGAGTAEDPYRIDTAEQLIFLGRASALCDRHFVLGADINLDPNLPGQQLFWQAVIPTFTGIFDGQGRCIFHLTIRGKNRLGLFGRLESGAEVKNLGVVEVNVTASGGYVGGLVGDNEGTVTNCHSISRVKGYDCVGGLAGCNHKGTITSSHSTGNVEGGSVGGLVGLNSQGTISWSYSTSGVTGYEQVTDVIGFDYAGGLVGGNFEGNISSSYSTGSVAGDFLVGGLVGINLGMIHSSYSESSVTGNCMVGGLVGENVRSSIFASCSKGRVTGAYAVGGLVGENAGSSILLSNSIGNVTGDEVVGGLVGENWEGGVTNCYSRGTVSGVRYVGGLVGQNVLEGDIATSYSTGMVSGNENVGGLVGISWGGTVVASFWDMQTSSQATSAGGTGRTTAEIQTASTFTDAGWDFVGESGNGTEDIWAICEGQDYPKLTWQFVVGDLDGDAHTDFADFCIFAERWLQTDSSFWCGRGGSDLTNDGNVDFYDLRYVADNWLATR